MTSGREQLLVMRSLDRHCNEIAFGHPAQERILEAVNDVVLLRGAISSLQCRVVNGSELSVQQCQIFQFLFFISN